MYRLATSSLAVQRACGEKNNESAKRVEAVVRTFSDAGSIPAASTNQDKENQGLAPRNARCLSPIFFMVPASLIDVDCRPSASCQGSPSASGTTAIPAASTKIKKRGLSLRDCPLFCINSIGKVYLKNLICK